MAARFWVAQPVSGAVVSVASPPQVRLTVSSTTGMTTGDTRTVFGVGGTTEANGTWTITVIDATHIDLQGTTFANLYTSGGAVNGRWDGTNTNNWVTTSGGTNYGQTVPGSADAVTLDGASGGGTVIPNVTITIQSLTCGAFTGTLDFSANNNNVTLSVSGTALNCSNTGTRTFNMGSGTWTISGANGFVSFSNTTGLTLSAASATIAFTGTGTRTFTSGTTSLTFGTITFSGGAAGVVVLNNSFTVSTLTISSPNFIQIQSGKTVTVTTLNIAGSSSGQTIGTITDVVGVAATISSASNQTITWVSLRDLTCSGGGTFTASNSFDLGHNTGITITAPAAGGPVGQQCM